MKSELVNQQDRLHKAAEEENVHKSAITCKVNNRNNITETYSKVTIRTLVSLLLTLNISLPAG